jgi:hypothetical protein
MCACKCDWDQRIPNNPIFNRSFLLAQPPMVLFERPVSTYGTKAEPVGQVNMATRMTQGDDLRLSNYWTLHTANKAPSGLLINPRENIYPSDVDPNRLAGLSAAPATGQAGTPFAFNASVNAPKFPGAEINGPAQPLLDQNNNLLTVYPRRPWQQGVTYNINAENAVKPYERHVYKDTLPFEQELEFTNQRMVIDAQARRNMQMNAPTEMVWNQTTSPKMNGDKRVACSLKN